MTRRGWQLLQTVGWLLLSGHHAVGQAQSPDPVEPAPAPDKQVPPAPGTSGPATAETGGSAERSPAPQPGQSGSAAASGGDTSGASSDAPGDAARDAAIFGASESDSASPAAERPEEAPAADGQGTERDATVFGMDDGARDAAMFGSQASAPEAEEIDLPMRPLGLAAAGDRDERILGDVGAQAPFADDVAPEDPLTIGGLMYLRSQSFVLQDQPVKQWRLTVPTLTQVYFDVRPNDRVRGYIQARIQYDPTLPAAADTGFAVGGPVAPGASSNGVQSLGSAFASRTRDPRFVLDQLWINFDVAYRAFVTVGKQHDRWGTGRFWMPTDYLHLQNRNPIDVFDSRAGTNMVKLHVPVESLAWNFYAYAVLESPSEATPSLSQVAGAGRAEFVFGTVELGLGLFGRRGESPRGAADLSFGVWDLDFYGEVALRDRAEVDRVRYDPNARLPPLPEVPSWQDPTETALARLAGFVDARFPTFRRRGVRAQAVGGVTYSIRYDDDDVLTLGGEYFYNGLGYTSSRAYMGLLLPRAQPLENPATFFYLGRHYMALFLMLPSPFHLDLHTFTLSTLGNLSDESFISRLDYAYTLLTHVRLEVFVAVHYGSRPGEFRFGIDDLGLGGGFSQPPSLLDVGLALRLEY